jgi:hypothetical protein
LEELREVLKLAFPGNKKIVNGIIKYYYSDYGNVDSGDLNVKLLPTQSVKLFLTKGYPKVMWVRPFGSIDYHTSWVKRVVIMEANDGFLVWDSVSTLEDVKYCKTASLASHAKDIEEPKEYTMQRLLTRWGLM